MVETIGESNPDLGGAVRGSVGEGGGGEDSGVGALKRTCGINEK